MHARLRLDPIALQHNLYRVRAIASGSKVMAVIKANGYGHGMLDVAHALEDVEGFAVANLDEGLQLRAAGVVQDILLLEGVLDDRELELAAEKDLMVVVHHPAQLDLLLHDRHGTTVKVWLKLDTGMHRLGFPVSQAREVWKQLHDCPSVKKPISIMSHFANADDPERPSTQQQINAFQEAVHDLKCELSIANSAGLCHWPEAHLDWVRPGIMLYGVNPFITDGEQDLNLKPAMTLSTRMIAVNQLKQGDAVGYGSTWECPEDMPVGVAAIGYGDGYPRHAVNGTPVLVNGKRAPLIGRVSMDMICIDLRELPQAQVGDEVILWGRGLPVEEIAQCSGTIAYELLCKITGRVHRELEQDVKE